MISLTTSAASNYLRWEIFGGFTWPASDPGLSSKTFGDNTTYFLGRYSPNYRSSGAFTVGNISAVNVPNAASRANFRTQLLFRLSTLASVIGVHTPTSSQELFYGADPINPGNVLWQFRIQGTCNITPPASTYYVLEYELGPSFQTIIPFSNNSCSLIYQKNP